MKKRTKAREILKTICGGVVMIGIQLFSILSELGVLVLISAALVILPISVALVLRLMAVAAVIFVTCIIIVIKIDKKEEKEYCGQYIIEMVIKDKTFGEIKFEKDTLKNELTCKSFKIPFGKYNPRIQIYNYEEKDEEIYLRSLEHVYSKQEEIIENLLETVLEGYSNSKELTPDTLKENFDIDFISIEKYGDCFLEDLLEGAIAENEENIVYWREEPKHLVAAVEGKLNFKSYYRFPIAYMDCKTKKICYILSE